MAGTRFRIDWGILARRGAQSLGEVLGPGAVEGNDHVIAYLSAEQNQWRLGIGAQGRVEVVRLGHPQVLVLGGLSETQAAKT